MPKPSKGPSRATDVAQEPKESPRERAERVLAERQAREEADRDELERHLASVDARLEKQKMAAAAQERKRRTRIFEDARREPPGRPMYDDKMLQLRAQVPGPGTYSPRLRNDTVGKTFGAQQFDAAVTYDKMAGTLDSYMEKTSLTQPGPASYEQKGASGIGQARAEHFGTTFGLSPKLMAKYPLAEVPSAHDMSRMVSHLRDLPGPKYSPSDPQPASKGFRMMLPSEAARSPRYERPSAPGPGTCRRRNRARKHREPRPCLPSVLTGLAFRRRLIAPSADLVATRSCWQMICQSACRRRRRLAVPHS